MQRQPAGTSARAFDGGDALDVRGPRLAVTTSSVGTLIAYATAPDEVAADGSGSHSPDTRSLLEWIDDPGLEIKEVFQRVRQDLIRKTDGRQVPWENSSLVGGGIYLGGD